MLAIERSEPSNTVYVRGAGGVRLAVRTAGAPDRPPIVFLHGWAANSTAWAGQLADPELTARHRLLAVDLRGHGESDVPDRGYDDPAVWAADVAAVLECAGTPAILVGWSYGGLVITDYLRDRGMAGVAGIVLVGAITEIGGEHPGGQVGSAWTGRMRPALSEDPTVAVPAIAALAARMTEVPASGTEVQRRTGDTLRVPPKVRGALFRRTVASGDVLAGITVPTLVMNGAADEIISPSAAMYAAGKIPGAVLRWFPSVGHLPFAERGAEFNAALLEFAGSITSH